MSTSYVPSLGLLPAGFGLPPELQAAIESVGAGSGGSLSEDVVKKIARSAPAPVPYPQSNRWYSAPYDTITPRAVTANRIYWIPVYLPYGGDMNKVGVKVTTGAPGMVKMALYPSLAMGGEGPVLGETQEFDTSTIGVKEGPLTWVVPYDPDNAEGNLENWVEPGLYFLAVIFSGTPTVNWHSSTSDSSWRQAVYGATSNESVVAPYHQYTNHTFSTPLPMYFGVSTDNVLQSEPHVWWRM